MGKCWDCAIAPSQPTLKVGWGEVRTPVGSFVGLHIGSLWVMLGLRYRFIPAYIKGRLG